jgi:hypothetical protein
MRRIVALVVLALPLALACKPKKGADGGADAGPVADDTATSEPPPEPSASASASASATHAAARPIGPPAVGNGCAPGKDSVACAPDGFEELTCAGGVWRLMQTCRGTGHCTGSGAALTCDVGAPQAGDACVPATSTPRCTNASTVLSCQNGRWSASVCMPPAKCQPNAKNGQPGCK